MFRAIVADGKIVGNISVEQKSDVYRKDAEIGYMLITEEWSRGIMTEAVKKICEEAFAELPILRITGNGLRTEHGIQTSAGEKWI